LKEGETNEKLLLDFLWESFGETWSFCFVFVSRQKWKSYFYSYI